MSEAALPDTGRASDEAELGVARTRLRLFMLSGWRGHLIVLSGLAAVILTLFAGDARDMVRIWWDSSTFQHCLIIPFVIGWLVHQRAGDLAKLQPEGWWPGLLLVGVGGIAWLLGQAAGVALFRHAGLVAMLQGAVVATLGWAVTRAIAFPIFYACFLVPFGEELVPMLQTVTAQMAMKLLALAGVPAHMEGVFITTPTGYFEVAEACSGAKFLIAMAAYAALVCNVCFRGWGRRAAFFPAALAISVLANGVRAFATIYVAHLTSVDAAVGFDHVVYGWVFFAIVIAAVMAAGWPFFNRKPGDPWFDARALQGAARPAARLAPVALGVLALACAGPLWAAFAAQGGAPLPSETRLPDVAGWQRTDARPQVAWTPHFSGADRIVQGRYRNAKGDLVDLVIVLFDRQEEGRELVGFGQGAAGGDGATWAWSANAPAPANGHGEQITGPGPVIRHVVSFYALGDVVTGSASTVKLETAKLRLTGGDQRAAAVLVSAQESSGRDADGAIAQFLNALGPIDRLTSQSMGDAP